MEHPIKTCDICRKEIDDEIELGQFMEKRGVRVHYYCLLVSTHLPQNGGDSSGILGFLIKDIKNEIRANKKRVCCFCNKKHASSKCQNCSRYYHLYCGLKNDCLFQFVDEFHSYCNDHHGISHVRVHSQNRGCYICMQEMGPYNPITSIRSSCCATNGWVHRRCLKEYALSAGYYLKCLWCNNKEFRREVQLLGIFVPDREAAWEHKGAFSCLYKRYSRCDAEKCLCGSGREFKNNSKWRIIVCDTCAASGMHLGCLSGPYEKCDEYKCKTCRDIYEHIPNTPNETSMNRKNKSSTDLDKSLYMPKSQPQSQHYYPCEKVDSSYTEMANNAPSFNSSVMQTIEPLSVPPLKLFVAFNPEDTSTLKYEFHDSKGNVVKKHEVNVEEDSDLKFDDELINELVAKLKSNQKLHESVITISDSDDSDASAGELLETIVKKTSFEVSSSSDTYKCVVSSDGIESCAKKRISSASCMNLKEKMELFFKDFRPDPDSP